MNNQLQDITQEQKQFSYQTFYKKSSYPVPLIAKNAKYNSMLPFKQLQFLQYFMLPEKDEFNYVYRPGDDSFFMLNVLKRQIPEWITKWGNRQSNSQQISLNNTIITQIGSGSGIISAHVSSWLSKIKQSPLLQLSIDINMDASLFSQKYYQQYGLPVEHINTSLFKNTIFSQKIRKQTLSLKPQIILFNPPYIPVDQQQIQNQQKYLAQKINFTAKNREVVRKRQQNMIAFSYMGGTDGLVVTRKLLKGIFWNCWVYLIIMGEQGYLKLMQELKQYKQFWPQNSQFLKINCSLQLMQFMKFQNQDLFLVRVQIIVQNNN